jgi:hypothetical protein
LGDRQTTELNGKLQPLRVLIFTYLDLFFFINTEKYHDPISQGLMRAYTSTEVAVQTQPYLYLPTLRIRNSTNSGPETSEETLAESTATVPIRSPLMP